MINFVLLLALIIPIDNPYGVIIGSYDQSTGISWYRDWNSSWDYPPGEGNRPANKLWTVGKLDDRREGPIADIDKIFAYELPIIISLIKAGWVGQTWEIGNEPNYSPYLSPADYSRQFKLYCDAIKTLDDSARCANGGLLLRGSWRLWARDLTIQPDVWSVHPYAYWDDNAGQMTIYKLQDFRRYLDEEELPGAIWITEFGYPGGDQRPDSELVTYISQVCVWLNYHAADYGIERWFWFSFSSTGNNALFSGQPGTLDNATPAGLEYLRQSRFRRMAYLPFISFGQ